MAAAKKNYKKSGNYKKNNYYNKKGKAYYQKKVSAQQRDLAKFTINVPTKLTVFNKTVNIPTSITDNSKFATRTIGCYALNIYDLLRKSAFFQNYSGMFDEFKINNVSVKLTPSSYLISGGQRYTAITVFTAWDRSGLEESQTFWNLAATTVGSVKVGQAADADGFYVTLGNEVTTYSSAQSRSLNPNTNTSITRYISPKALLEKSQYLSTDSLKPWYEGFDNLQGRYYGIPVEQDAAATIIGIQGGVNVDASMPLNEQAQWATRAYRNSPAIKENPCFLLEDNAIAFKPTLLIGIYPQDTFEEMIGSGNNPGYTTTNTPNPLYTQYKEMSDTYLTTQPDPAKIASNNSKTSSTLTTKVDGWNLYTDNDGNISTSGTNLILDLTGKYWGGDGITPIADNTAMTEEEKTKWKQLSNPYSNLLSTIPQFITTSTPITTTNNSNSVTQNPIIFNVEADIDVQFRGVRKAQQVNVQSAI